MRDKATRGVPIRRQDEGRKKKGRLGEIGNKLGRNKERRKEGRKDGGAMIHDTMRRAAMQDKATMQRKGRLMWRGYTVIAAGAGEAGAGLGTCSGDGGGTGARRRFRPDVGAGVGFWEAGSSARDTDTAWRDWLLQVEPTSRGCWRAPDTTIGPRKQRGRIEVHMDVGLQWPVRVRLGA